MVLFKNPSENGRTQSAMSSSVRGRISGPIPIDDEFPTRKPGSVNALEGESRQLQSSAAGSSNLTAGNAPSDVAREDKTDSVAQSGPSQASNASGSPQNRRTMRASTVRYSVVSSDSGPSRPQRKRSTLKSTLGRIFGRKKKSTSELPSIDVPIPEPPSVTQHHSDTSALSQRFPKEGDTSKRSASLPITEYSKALRSHSVGPNDMVAIESVRDSVQLESDRRRATTSSRILSTGSNEINVEIVGLTPRPASVHGRGSHVADTENPEDIGRAITSDNLAHRRRSRSLSQLQNMVGSQTEVRRRSAEIRYWRDSRDPESPHGGDNDESSHVEVETPAEPMAEPSPLVPPPQPLTFPPTTNIKITGAASLEDRVASLEARNQKLIKLVSQLFEVLPGVDAYAEPPSAADRTPSFTFTATSSAPANSSLYRTTSNDIPPWSRQSEESFGDGLTFIGSAQPSTAPVPRPTSNTTVRGTVRESTSLPTLPKDVPGAFTADHYTTLKALIDTEVAARQALEAQVKKLTFRVNRMSRSAHGPDPGFGPRNGTLSMFEHDDDDDELPTPSYDNYSESDYKTPNEEFRPQEFGAVREEEFHDEDDFSRKRAPRTLSLGQLTLGKHPRGQRELQSPGVVADL